MGMRERTTGNVRAFPIADTRTATFEKQVRQNVTKGATRRTHQLPQPGRLVRTSDRSSQRQGVR